MEIVQIKDRKDILTFIDFPHSLYEGDKNYVPEIYLAMKEHFDPKKNPFFAQATVDLFLAYDNGKIVGRIAAILNRNYNEYHHCKVAFFGFFDCINDQKVANALLDAAMGFAKKHQVDRVLGPTNFSTNDTAGLLVDGFDGPPMIQMTYNKPYYQMLIEQYGFSKEMDLMAYYILTKDVNDKALKLSAALRNRLQQRGITFRNFNPKKFKDEVEKVREIYKSAWEKNWGFVPPTDAEFDFLAEGLKMVIDPKFAYIAEHNGKMVGFAVGLPNINEIAINIKKGRLFPFGIFKLLFGKSKVKSVRVVLLGVVEEYRKIGIEAVFFADFIEAARKNNIVGGEASWILENNQMMVAAAENLNGKPYRRYRIFSKDVA